ncbi:MAG: isoleucine--tRNA ligase [Isosphaeraceae bacterium]|jgi:isoleucyl-tRNA synthetase|nr:MAG: isoleucine--tRNA ligase [Isosphaeraceae bacterium]
MATPAKPYKDTLNLPVTRFEMKANLAAREPALQQRWQSERLYDQIRQARSGQPRRVLHDGPPYANGDIHMGHLLNKVLKDLVVRYLTMRGYDSPYVPGWDCHGLPIEHKVVKDLGPRAAALDPAQIRDLCRADALRWVDIQRAQFQRLGILGDWDRPYLTLQPRYEAAILDVLADLVAGGYVFRQLKPIHWCPHDRTALAEAELEYRDQSTPSIYVNFPILNGTPAAWGDGPWHAMIWTTTPWTLPANVAIAVHPELVYLGIRYTDPDSGSPVQTILAADLVPKVLALRGITQFEELGRCTGAELEHAQYRHVFLDRASPIVLADYVTVADGTGLVHTAPGHGAEDYRTGQKYGLPTLSPVDESGRFSDEAPDWLRGQQVWQANPAIVARLRELGWLFHDTRFDHSYPHCWRCKKPVLFRATAQWFIGVDRDDLRGRTRKIIDDSVRWLPAWGRSRIGGMIDNRPDWCISRQRHWGVPIPVLYDDRTGEPHLTPASVRFHRDLFAREGADAWYTRPVDQLVPPDLDPSTHPIEHLRKGTDILDVWFESGSSHRAVLAGPDGLGFPAFLYLEGSDQHRGWFQSSILTAVATTGLAPFETVLTHGFVVDDKGEKMSKSVGNALSAVQATEQYGADVLRLYVASMDYADDVRMSERGIKESSEAYRKIRNTFRFLLGNLADYADFDPAAVHPASLHPVDRWALGLLNSVIREATDAFERFEFYRAYQRIYHFCSVELSSIYLDVLKDRLYAELPHGPDRRAAQFALARIHEALARLLAPILPHTCEEVWGFLPDQPARPSSVHLALWPEPDPAFDNPELANRFARLLELRERIFVALETLRKDKAIGSNQEAAVAIRLTPPAAAALQPDLELLTTLCIVSEITLTADPAAAEPIISATRSRHPKCERCWNLRPSVGLAADHPTLCARCVAVLRALEASPQTDPAASLSRPARPSTTPGSTPA